MQQVKNQYGITKNACHSYFLACNMTFFVSISLFSDELVLISVIFLYLLEAYRDGLYPCLGTGVRQALFLQVSLYQLLKEHSVPLQHFYEILWELAHKYELNMVKRKRDLHRQSCKYP